MNAPSKSALLHRLSIDSVIFSVIVVATMLLMSVRLHNRVVERDRGMVIYTPTVAKETAHQLAGSLKHHGLFRGTPSSVFLDQTDAVHEIRIVVAQESLNTGNGRQRLADAFNVICGDVFKTNAARVQLSNDAFEPYAVLLEYP